MDHLGVAVERMSKEQLVLAAYALSQHLADTAAQGHGEQQSSMTENGRLVARLIMEIAKRDGIEVRSGLM